MEEFIFPICITVIYEEKAFLDKAKAEAAVPGAEFVSNLIGTQEWELGKVIFCCLCTCYCSWGLMEQVSACGWQ